MRDKIALPHAISDLRTGLDARLACRRGRLTGSTGGVAPGYVQGNLAILPKDLAADFLRFCQANPKPCPIIGVSDVGDPHLRALGADLDIRTDLPGYRVWKDGALVEETPDVSSWWRDDLVSFVIGCSYSFEQALVAEGIPLRHIERGTRVPMYRTNIACMPAGPFAGPMVVSMWPLTPANAIRAIQITSRYPAVHGAPVHIGLPELIGIKDVMKPDHGDVMEVIAGVLGVRRYPASGDRHREAAIRDHPRTGLYAGDRPREPPLRPAVIAAKRATSLSRRAHGRETTEAVQTWRGRRY